MNGFTKLFSKRRKRIAPEKKPDITSPDHPNSLLSCSESVFTEHKKLSPTTLKKPALLRDMDDAYVEQLAHTALSYVQASVFSDSARKPINNKLTPTFLWTYCTKPSIASMQP
ncbi:hypothetical protein [Methylobacter svalbardensis]|uniref:hypothetical protein n=1 Tax=Methylobacter svalbardensis TaxID=3080016 RepID=UPI0030EBCEF5